MNVPHSAFKLMLRCAIGVMAVSLTAAAQVAEAQEWTAPRTEHGQPDMQGKWSNAFVTPVLRPEGQGPTLSLEEVAEAEGRATSRLESSFEPLDPNRPAPSAGGGTGAYDRFYVDSGDRVVIVNGERRSSFTTRPANGRLPPLTAEGKRRRAEQNAFGKKFGEFDHPELLPTPERCLMPLGPRNGPPMFDGGYNNNFLIVQTADHVVIMAEQLHGSRIIPLGEGPRLARDIRLWSGDSWGRWDGETLVVETTNIHPDQNDVIPRSVFANELDQRAGNQPSAERRVIERFTRVDEETLLYEFTVEDPVIYTEPWGGEIPMWRQHDQMYEYACHEANYGMFNILRGARYEERQSDEQGR
jgi:hypothetical protein